MPADGKHSRSGPGAGASPSQYPAAAGSAGDGKSGRERLPSEQLLGERDRVAASALTSVVYSAFDRESAAPAINAPGGGSFAPESDGVPLIRTLVEQGAVGVAFQPIIDIRRRKVFAYEVLARPTHPSFHGNPAAMFQAAADHKLAGQLGRLVRTLSTKIAPNVPLFFNVHPSELDSHYIVQPDDPIFQHTEAVYLEVTEQVPLTQFLMCKPVLKEVAGRGIHLVVDDLGAGYSNLKYIADLNPRVVKIDRELIIGLTVNTRLFKLVRSIVSMCHDLDADVVVEGIETREEFEAVRETGAAYAQGYFIAKPLINGLPPISLEVRQTGSKRPPPVR